MTSKISQLTKDKQIFQINGIVVSKTGVRDYTTGNGRKGQLISFVMKDDTGSIRITIFDKLIETLLNDVEIGQNISLCNGFIKDGYYGGLDITANLTTVIQRIDSDNEEKVSQISAITSSDTYVNIIGIVKTIAPITSITTKDGRNTRKRDITICDDSGKAINWIRWGDDADEVFQIGSALELKYCRVQCYNGIQITGGSYQRIEKSQKVKSMQLALKKFRNSEVQNLSTAVTSFCDINVNIVKRNGNNMVFIAECFVESVVSTNKFLFCTKCNRKSTADRCLNCGSKALDNFVTNVSLRDDSGTIRASVFKNTAETVFGSSFDNVDDAFEKFTGVRKNITIIAQIEEFQGNEYLKFKIIK